MADTVIQLTKTGTVITGTPYTDSFTIDLTDTDKSYGRSDAGFFFEFNLLVWSEISGGMQSSRWLSTAITSTSAGGLSLVGTAYEVGTPASPYLSLTTTDSGGLLLVTISTSSGPYNWRLFINTYICEDNL